MLWANLGQINIFLLETTHFFDILLQLFSYIYTQQLIKLVYFLMSYFDLNKMYSWANQINYP